MIDLSALEALIARQRVKVNDLAEAAKNRPDGYVTWDAISATATVLMERHRHAGLVEAWEVLAGAPWPGVGSWEPDDSV